MAVLSVAHFEQDVLLLVQNPELPALSLAHFEQDVLLLVQNAGKPATTMTASKWPLACKNILK